MINFNTIEILIAIIAGGMLSITFFGSLWFTTQKLPTIKYPVLLIIGSLVLRFAVILIVCYWVLVTQDWQILVVGLVSFTLARLLIISQVNKS